MHITHLVCSVNAINKNANHTSYSLYSSSPGRNCVQCTIHWMEQPKSHSPSEKILRVRPVWASPGILSQVSQAKGLPLEVSMWLYCFLITLLQLLPVWSVFNLQAFSSTLTVLRHCGSQSKHWLGWWQSQHVLWKVTNLGVEWNQKSATYTLS